MTNEEDKDNCELTDEDLLSALDENVCRYHYRRLKNHLFPCQTEGTAKKERETNVGEESCWGPWLRTDPVFRFALNISPFDSSVNHYHL